MANGAISLMQFGQVKFCPIYDVAINEKYFQGCNTEKAKYVIL